MAYGAEYDSDALHQTLCIGAYNTGRMLYNAPEASAQTCIYDALPFGVLNNTEAASLVELDMNQSCIGSDESATASIMLDYSDPASVSDSDTYHQNISPLGGANDISAVQDLRSQEIITYTPESTNHSKKTELEGRWLEYQRKLSNVFEEITVGNLERAGGLLLNVSVWLLSQVTDLGLTEDDGSLHSDRLQLWNDFNHAWLSLAYKQKLFMITGQRTIMVQQPLSHKTVCKMGDELIRLCDGIARYGLVDYQYGVWEEEIEALLEECLDMHDSMSRAVPDAEEPGFAGSGASEPDWYVV